MSDRLRWGFLGTGNIARQFVGGIIEADRAELVAVGSREPGKAADFASRNYPTARAGSYADVIAAADVDAAYVALPNSMHHEWTLKALAAGKHVLCEKPIASNVDQAEEMFQVAQQQDRLLMEAFMYRSHPQSLAVVEAVRSGVIGELRVIRTSFSFQTRKPEGNVRFSREMAGGSLMDVGCYCVDFSRWLAGAEPESVHVDGQLHDSGIDQVVVGTMRFPNGVFASFTSGLTCQADNSAYLCGSEGYIAVPVPWKPGPRGATFTVHRQPPPLADNIQSAGPQSVAETFVIDANRQLFTLEVEAFTRAVLDGSLPPVSAACSLGNMRVLDEMRRQLRVI